MNNYTIENNELIVIINDKGAELQSLYSKVTQLEYMWCGDEKFWGKKSPVLFPIVGGLKNNTYTYNNKEYQLNRHGFARDKTFTVNEISDDAIEFTLFSNPDTLQQFPFEFEFIVRYNIEKNKLICTYHVKNLSNNTMYFSVGAHPAFKVPLLEQTNFNDWYIELNKLETCGIYPLTDKGLLKTETTPLLQDSNRIELTKNLFYKDALVFKELKSDSISIKSNGCSNGLTMHYNGFNYFGIWSAKDANFVCLEPWCGIADSEHATGVLTDKEGINSLQPNSIFSKEWCVEVY